MFHCQMFLSEFGIEIGSYVESIGGIFSKESFSDKLFSHNISKSFTAEKLNILSDKSGVRVLMILKEKIIKKLN